MHTQFNQYDLQIANQNIQTYTRIQFRVHYLFQFPWLCVQHAYTHNFIYTSQTRCIRVHHKTESEGVYSSSANTELIICMGASHKRSKNIHIRRMKRDELDKDSVRRP